MFQWHLSVWVIGLVRIVWGWIGKDMKNGRKEAGESGGIGVDFFHFDFCIVNGQLMRDECLASQAS